MVNIALIWTDELEDKICEVVAKNSASITKILKKYDGLPCVDEVYKRMHAHKPFAEKYARAKQLQVFTHAEAIFDIIDDMSRDKGENGLVAVQRDRLRSDKRQWYVAKLAPKIFGDMYSKKLPMRLDLSKPLDVLSQQIIDKLALDEINLDEAKGAFEVLEKYAELVKIKEFEFTLSNLRAQLEQQQNKVSVGEIQHGRQKMDSKSNKTSGRAKKKTSRKKGKINPRSKAKKSRAQQKPKDSKASALGNDTQEDAQEE